MKTRAVRLYGKKDLRLEEFELPQIKENEILAKVICDSLCMSSYKAASQGADHKRIPNDCDVNPVIIGHEFAGELMEIGSKWKNKFKVGDKFSIQPAITYPGSRVGVLGAPGYSYSFIGGDATYVIIPNEVMEADCLLPYTGEGFYPGSLAEPLSCVIGAIHANYHTTPGSYIHKMEIVDGGKMALLAGVGPMGLAAINYVLHRDDRKPSLLIVTDIDQIRLDRAAGLYTVAFAASRGIDLRYVNTSKFVNAIESLKEISGGEGFNDIFVFAPVAPVVEQADALLAFDGCLNFFAGPSDPHFKASLNFYNVHYAYTHIVGTSGGNTADMKEALVLMSAGLDPAGLVTHIGGINAVIDATLHLPEIPGGKKLIYNHIEMALTPITEFVEKGKTNPVYARLAEICDQYNGLWSTDAEAFLLENAEGLLKQTE